MTIQELAARDAAYRREVLTLAIAEERRGFELRTAASASTVNIARNIARLERLLGEM